MPKKHEITVWEVSFIEFETEEGKKYKVTLRYPDLCVAETRIFRSKEQAKRQFDAWLR